MVPLFPLASLLFMLAPDGSAFQAAPPPPPPRVFGGSIRIQIVRLPMRAMSSAALSVARIVPPISWVERKMGHCVAVNSISAVAVGDSNSIDLLLSGGKRVRARLGSDCPSLDFYSGMYLKPSSDGQLCADRDWVRTRSGGQCQIEGFRALVPAR